MCSGFPVIFNIALLSGLCSLSFGLSISLFLCRLLLCFFRGFLGLKSCSFRSLS
jgi:hypothetical protein